MRALQTIPVPFQKTESAVLPPSCKMRTLTCKQAIFGLKSAYGTVRFHAMGIPCRHDDSAVLVRQWINCGLIVDKYREFVEN